MKSKIIYIWLLLACWLAKEARAQQVPEISYDKSRSFRSERIFLEPDSSNVERYANRVAFLDGFGREYVTIDVQGSPVAGYDIVQPFHYGKDGKTDRAYLPCALAGNYGKLPANPFDPENWQLIGQDKGYAFSPITYEGRLSGRVTAQMKPGKAWHDAGKSMAYDYGYNTANEIKMLKTTSSGTIEDGGYYPAGILEKVTATDEDGRKAETFTDKDGKTILTRELLGAEWLETWYAYDEKGQLRYVFPPELTKDSGFWTDKDKLGLYAWSFAYDKEGRMVGQKAPGCEPVTYKYEPFYDRLLEMQDGALREKGESIMFTYDKQGRLQHTVLNSKNSMLYLEDLLYDSPGRNFVPTPGYSQDYSGNTAGYLTARNAYLVYAGNNTFVQTNYYYDSEGRIIQQVEKTLSRTTLRTDYKYDFPGNLVAVREAHTYEGKTDVVEQLMRYDDRGRIKETSLSLNGTPCAKVYYTYDHAGRLAGKIAGKASQVFRYNAQGWLTEMEGSAFGYKLRYEAPENGGTDARWNGSISEWEWKQGTESPMMYAFQYDGLERLEGATQFKETESGWQAMENSFTEKGISYDRNGNILTLQRTANGTTVDDLAYSYNGNLMESVTENVRTSPNGDIYAPGNTANSMFEFDENGNLVKNGHLGLVFQYNCLNLPSYVKRDGKILAAFYYLGDGTKARAVDSVGVARYNIGSLTYRQEGSRKLVLEEIAFDGGIVKVGEDGTPETFYCITDHLGSVRAMVDADGNAVERNDYYPFGAQHARADYPQITNRYKFNGKEREKAGGADWLDYGARRYDPALARWTTPDPLGDSYLPYSPYAYCLNNPVKLVDPDGTFSTHYVDEYYNVLFSSDDGSDDVFMVSEEKKEDFLKNVISSAWDEDRLNSAGWNNYWRDEFELAERQLTEAEIAVADMFHSNGARNNAIAYFLKPDIGNALKLGITEALNQWLDPELVASGLSAGIAGLANMPKAINVPKAASAGSYSLYQGWDDMRNVRYIGITSRPLRVRFNEHLNSKTPRANLRYEAIEGYENLSKINARINEQKFINRYQMEKNGGILYNKINSIAPKYWKQYGIK